MKLKPCPICTSNKINLDENKKRITCEICGCTQGDQTTISIAVGRWNNRPFIEKLEALIIAWENDASDLSNIVDKTIRMLLKHLRNFLNGEGY